MTSLRQSTSSSSSNRRRTRPCRSPSSTLTKRWDEVVELTEGIQNEDDASAVLLCYRGMAFREQGFHDAAREALKEALRARSRPAEIRHLALSERAANYLAQGKKGLGSRADPRGGLELRRCTRAAGGARRLIDLGVDLARLTRIPDNAGRPSTTHSRPSNSGQRAH